MRRVSDGRKEGRRNQNKVQKKVQCKPAARGSPVTICSSGSGPDSILTPVAHCVGVQSLLWHRGEVYMLAYRLLIARRLTTVLHKSLLEEHINLLNSAFSFTCMYRMA
jgi:hypothetical protein